MRAVCCFVLTLLLFTVTLVVKAQSDPILRIYTGIATYDVAWSPNGELLAVASDEGVIIYSALLRPLTQLSGHAGAATTVSWSPDGERLASGGGLFDNKVRIWHYDETNNTFALERTLPSYGTDDSLVFLVSWSPDGQSLAYLSLLGGEYLSGGYRVGAVGVWNTSTWHTVLGEPLLLLEQQRSLTWSPDSRRLATMTLHGLTILDALTYDVVFGAHPNGLEPWNILGAVDWSSSNQVVTVGSEIELWSSSFHTPLLRYPDVLSSQVEWNPQGTVIAVDSNLSLSPRAI